MWPLSAEEAALGPGTTTEPLKPFLRRTQAASGCNLHQPIPGGNRPRGRCWVIDRDTIVIKHSLTACRYRCARTGSPLGPAVQMGLGSTCKGQTVKAKSSPNFHTTAWWQNVSCPMGAIWRPASPQLAWLWTGRNYWRKVSAPRAGRCPTQALARSGSPTRLAWKCHSN